MQTTSRSAPESSQRAARASLGNFRVAIIGGGTAGITVAARLAKVLPAGQIVLVEPSGQHFYQPLWTLVAAGIVPKEKSVRDEARYIPNGVRWVQDYVEEIDPRRNQLSLRSGGSLGYELLVVAPGIQLDWDKVEGLRESLGRDGVASIYGFAQAERTWELLQQVTRGTALFTMPSTPVKCAGAPQKIMYLAEEHFRRRGVRQDVNILGRFGTKAIFGIKPIAESLTKVLARAQIDFQPHHNLIAIRPERREAVFHVTRGEQTETITLGYDFLHVVPPQSAPDFIKRSPLAVPDALGWAKVEKFTLQNPDFPNVFALGDASSAPTSRTGAAIRKQAPVVVENLLAVMHGRAPTARYNGYASCPLVTGYNKVILAEFDYDGNLTPSFPLDPTQERYSMYLMKRYALPALYWNAMLRGRSF